MVILDAVRNDRFGPISNCACVFVQPICLLMITRMATPQLETIKMNPAATRRHGTFSPLTWVASIFCCLGVVVVLMAGWYNFVCFLVSNTIQIEFLVELKTKHDSSVQSYRDRQLHLTDNITKLYSTEYDACCPKISSSSSLLLVHALKDSCLFVRLQTNKTTSSETAKCQCVWPPLNLTSTNTLARLLQSNCSLIRESLCSPHLTGPLLVLEGPRVSVIN